MVANLATTPVMPPPAGMQSNFDGSTYLQHTLIVVYSVTFAIATLTLVLRLYTRVAIIRGLGLDERKKSLQKYLLRVRTRLTMATALIILSWGLSLAFFITMVICKHSLTLR